MRRERQARHVLRVAVAGAALQRVVDAQRARGARPEERVHFRGAARGDEGGVGARVRGVEERLEAVRHGVGRVEDVEEVRAAREAVVRRSAWERVGEDVAAHGEEHGQRRPDCKEVLHLKRQLRPPPALPAHSRPAGLASRPPRAP